MNIQELSFDGKLRITLPADDYTEFLSTEKVIH
jgi:hypothetical protein